MRRRAFLHGVCACGAFVATVGSGLSWARSGVSPSSSREAFRASTEAEVLARLFGSTQAHPSDAVTIHAPLQARAEKGVPIEVECRMDGVERIAVLTRNNRYPLNSIVRLQGAEGYYSTRVRIERSSPVLAYVKAGDKLYFAAGEVKLSRGGYGT